MNNFRAENIEDVITIMDEIIRNCRLRESRVAYFTVLYRTTTYLVKKRCDEGGFFEDDDRMRLLDVIFANFYFDSFFADQHFETEPPSESWKVSFDATDDPDVVLIQHLLMGMNAHISLDLGVATAIVAGGDLNDSLKRDFYLLNSLLASLIQVVQSELSEVSPLMSLAHRLTSRFLDYGVDHGIRFARSRAWHIAEKLTATPRDQWTDMIVEHDKQVANTSRRIWSPGVILQPALWVIRQQEKSVPHEIISGLAGEKWYEAAHQKVLDVIGKIEDPNIDFMKRETHLMRTVQIPADSDQ